MLRANNTSNLTENRIKTNKSFIISKIMPECLWKRKAVQKSKTYFIILNILNIVNVNGCTIN